MKKSLIAMAVAGAMLAPAANAATTLYGQVEEAWVDSDNETVYLSEEIASSEDQKHRSNTRVGIKGSEDLGGGLSAIFQIETQVKDAGGPRSGGSTWNADRNTFVGLKGSFGTILGGRHDTPEKISTSYLDKFDATGVDPYGAIMENNMRANGTLAYISPNLSGITFGLALVPGEKQLGERELVNRVIPRVGTLQTREVDSGWADAISAMIKYKNGPLTVGIGHTTYDVPNPSPVLGSKDVQSTRFGIHYGQGNFDVGFVYQQTDGTNRHRNVLTDDVLALIGGSIVSTESDAWYVTGKYKFSNNYILVGYGKSENETSVIFGPNAPIPSFRGNTYTVEPEATVYGIEFGHNFSKRTKVYLGYSSYELDEYDQIGEVATRKKTATSIGLKHKF